MVPERDPHHHSATLRYPVFFLLPFPWNTGSPRMAKYAHCLTKSPSRKLPVITDVTFIDAAVAFTPGPAISSLLAADPPRLSLARPSQITPARNPSRSLHLSAFDIPFCLFLPEPGPHPRGRGAVASLIRLAREALGPLRSRQSINEHG